MGEMIMPFTPQAGHQPGGISHAGAAVDYNVSVSVTGRTILTL